MKKFLKNKFICNYLVLILFSMLIEIIFRLESNASIFDYSVFRIFISNSIISVIVAYIEMFFSDKLCKVINSFLIFFMTVYSFFQLGFKNFIGVYASFQASTQLGAVTSYVKEFIMSFKSCYYFVWLPFIILMLLNFWARKSRYINVCCKKVKFNSLVFALIAILSVIYYGTLKLDFMQNDLQIVSNLDLIKNTTNASIAIKQFGTNMYFILDVGDLLFKGKSTLIVSDYNANNEIEISSRQVDDQAWNEIIKNEENADYQKLNNYFINQSIDDYNDYTGIFKDKNLIVIMMESVNDIFINEELFPNFYLMYSNGWHFENNYSPRNSCATGNNEMSGMTSLYSIYNICTANVYKNNKYPNSIFGLFNNDGYKTTSMHDFTEAYYYRKTIHTNMGSGRYYGVGDLGISYSNTYGVWASDEDFMGQVVNILNEYDNDEKFMTWLTTVTSHQPYNSSKYGNLYYNEFKKLGYSNSIAHYMSKLKVLDNGLGVLINGLKEKGIYDDTVIVMYGDHYPYGIPTSEINTVLDYDTSVNYEAERVPFVIYNSSIEPMTISSYTSYINILPTIANLFDLNYDPRLYMGRDLFSNNYQSMVVFADGSFRNEHAFYDASISKITYYDDFRYTDDEILAINEEIDYKMQYSRLAIVYNYFDYLDKLKKSYMDDISNRTDSEDNK